MSRLLAFAVLACVSALTILAAAQPAPRAPTGPTSPAATASPSSLDAGHASRSPTGDIVEQKTLDGGARVFRFGEVEVEGRMKSPQIVYFLRRVRAEFAASDLGHRPFLQELGETRNEPAF